MFLLPWGPLVILSNRAPPRWRGLLAGVRARAAFLPAYEEVMLKQWHKMPPVFVTSGNTGEGREEVLRFISSTNGLYQP